MRYTTDAWLYKWALVMASTANWKYTQRQRGDTNAQTDGDRSKNDHSGTTDELFGRVDTQQMEGQQWRRQIANPLPKKYQLLSARQKYSVSVIVVRRSPDYRFEEPFLPTVMEVSGWGIPVNGVWNGMAGGADLTLQGNRSLRTACRGLLLYYICDSNQSFLSNELL